MNFLVQKTKAGKKTKFLVCALLGSVAIFPSARAATTEADTIETVVVTAEKRSADLEKTPIAISAYSEADIRQKQITNIKDLQYTTPGLVFGETSNISQVTLRGIGIQFTSVGAEAGVATYVDGVYQGRTFLQSQDYTGLERIEVLRGPQGTLYGRNATGGVINYITKTASFDTEAGVQAIVGSYDRLETEGWVGGTIVDGVIAGRLDYVRDSHDNYVQNLLTGQPYDHSTYQSARGNLLFQIDPNTDFVLRADWTQLSGGSPVAEQRYILPGAPGPQNPDPLAIAFPPVDTHTGLPVPIPPPGLTGPDPWHQYLNTLPNNRVHEAGVSGTLTTEWDGITFKSITAWQQYYQNVEFDLDGTSANWFTQNSQEASDQFSEEVNILGSAFNGSLDWIVGGFYLNDNSHGRYAPTLVGQTAYYDSLFESFGGAPDWTTTTPLFGPPQNNPILQYDFRQKLQSYAGFGQATYHISDRLRVTAGIRYTSDTKDVLFSETGIGGSCSASVDGPFKGSWDGVTPKIGVDYDASDDTLVYATATRGFKGGGLNAFTCGAPDPSHPGAFLGNAYNPEYVWAYEGGTKSRLFGGLATLNLAGFYYDYSNIQIQNFVPAGIFITNASSATIYGAEAELVARPMEQLQLAGTLGYLHARYNGGPAIDPFTNAPLPNGLANKDLPLSPTWKASFSIAYGFNLGSSGTLTPQFEFSYTDKFYFDALDTAVADQPSYTILNARLTYAFPETNAEIEGFIQNIQNTVHYETCAPSITAYGGVGCTIAPPRTAGVRAIWRL